MAITGSLFGLGAGAAAAGGAAAGGAAAGTAATAATTGSLLASTAATTAATTTAATTATTGVTAATTAGVGTAATTAGTTAGTAATTGSLTGGAASVGTGTAAGTATGAGTTAGTTAGASTIGAEGVTSAATTTSGATAGSTTTAGSGTLKSSLIAAGKEGLKGAAIGATTSAGQTALQGGSLEDIAKSAAIGGAEGGISGAIAGGAGQGISSVKAGSTTAGSHMTTPAQGTTPGKPTMSEITNAVKPSGIATGVTNTPSGLLDISNNAGTNATTINPPTTKQSKGLLGKIGGQVVAQGALSLVSGAMAAKTAKEANEIQKQSLLFQQQTYDEQKAERESKESQLKTDAWNAYKSASSFGEKLYNSGTNTRLFTKDYKENPTGNYSVLSGNFGKLTDYT